ncbi:MAG TPA: porin [Paraburkholderia sp.]|nr:porin [Paraburkholderia sp.]
MKRIIACLPLAACVAANAQSSVTLYGAVDAALTYTSNQGGKAAWQASSGGRAGDKFGLQGVEDLGGNLKAVFVLESGFSIEDGTEQPSNTLFGRQAYVGLSSTWGTVLLGRQYTMTNDYLGPLGTDTLFAGGLGATLGDLDGSWNYNKISSVVKFNSTDMHGFRYSAMYSLGGLAGDFATNRGYGFGASYVTGGLTLAAAYMNMSTPATSIFWATSGAVAGEAYKLPVTNPIFSNYTTANTQQVAGAGAGYVFGRSQITALYTNVRYQDIVRTLANPTVQPNASFNNYQLNYQFRFTPSTMAGIGYQYSIAPRSKYQSVDLGTAYFLSKTTYLYGIAVWQHASGTDSTGKAAVPNLLGLAPSSNSNQLALRVGLRHLF